MGATTREGTGPRASWAGSQGAERPASCSRATFRSLRVVRVRAARQRFCRGKQWSNEPGVRTQAAAHGNVLQPPHDRLARAKQLMRTRRNVGPAARSHAVAFTATALARVDRRAPADWDRMDSIVR